MCGIAGIMRLDGVPAAIEDVRAMTDAMRHRGPNGDGYYAEGSVAIGHRRLSILDLSDNAAQPMSSADGRYRIVYNGEVFNFVELRTELKEAGHVFRTTSDTEVVLEAFVRWGEACLDRFNGMWALAIWDSREKKLFLARDRFGIKPLLVLEGKRTWAFASEFKGLLALPGRETRLDPERLRAFAAGIPPTEPETVFENVRYLPAGHLAWKTLDGYQVKRWWNTAEHLSRPPDGLKKQAEGLLELLVDACRIRLRSDVPVATCLSGGLDSSTIVCLLAQYADTLSDRMQRDWHRAFHMRFPGTPLDEYDYAEPVARAAGLKLSVSEMKHPDPEAIRRALWAADFPTVGQSYYPICEAYRQVGNAGLHVSLDGEGVDEMMGGYFEFVHAGPAALEDGDWRRLWDLMRTYAPTSRNPQFDSRREVWRTLARQIKKPRVLWRAAKNTVKRMAGIHTDSGFFTQHLYERFHVNTLPPILQIIDRCAMASSVEVRMPFMDYRLVTYVLSLPTASRSGGGYTKRVLREAMAGVVPDLARLRRTKTGFGAPLVDWMRSDALGPWVRDLAAEKAFLQSPYWDGPAFSDRLSQWFSGRDRSWGRANEFWNVLNLHLWIQMAASSTG